MKTFAFSGKSDLSGAGNATEEKGAVERNLCTTRSPGPALGELSPPGAFQCRAPLLGVLRFLRFLKTSHILVLNKSSLCALLPLLAKRTLAIFFACKTEVSPESKLHRKMRGIALTGWLSWLKRCPQTPESGGGCWYPFRARTWVALRSPFGAHTEGDQSMFLSHIDDVSLSPPPSLCNINKNTSSGEDEKIIIIAK